MEAVLEIVYVRNDWIYLLEVGLLHQSSPFERTEMRLLTQTA